MHATCRRDRRAGPLPDNRRFGVGVLNQKTERVDPVEAVVARARHAIDLFGAERVLLNPDCGFATFADNPIVSAARPRPASPSSPGPATSCATRPRRLVDCVAAQPPGPVS